MGEITAVTCEDETFVAKATGEFDVACVAEARAALAAALESVPQALRLDLSEVESADLTFLQLLFSLAVQARLDGKRVVLATALSEPLRRAAENLGFSQRDFHQAFCSGDDA